MVAHVCLSVCLRHSQSFLCGPNGATLGLTEPLANIIVVFQKLTQSPGDVPPKTNHCGFGFDGSRLGTFRCESSSPLQTRVDS